LIRKSGSRAVSIDPRRTDAGKHIAITLDLSVTGFIPDLTAANFAASASENDTLNLHKS
jgi:hypothetical protein